MPEAVPRVCSKCSINNISTVNKTGVCTPCQQGRGVGGSTAEAPPNSNKVLLKKFHIVADAIGADGDQLIADFCEGWLENIRRTAAVSRD